MIETIRQAIITADTAGRLGGRVRPHIAAVGESLPFAVVDVRESPLGFLDAVEYATYDVTITIYASDAATSRAIAKTLWTYLEELSDWSISEVSYDADVPVAEQGDAVYRAEIRGTVVANG
mgnify:CR=1 FL=1